LNEAKEAVAGLVVAGRSAAAVLQAASLLIGGRIEPQLSGRQTTDISDQEMRGAACLIVAPQTVQV
jgi:hypothetical protein